MPIPEHGKRPPSTEDLVQRILALLKRRPNLRIAVLEGAVDVPRRQRKGLRGILDGLCRDGRLQRSADGRYRLPTGAMLCKGRFRLDSRGRAFVEDEERRRYPLASGEGQGALDGDLVAFRHRPDRQSTKGQDRKGRGRRRSPEARRSFPRGEAGETRPTVQLEGIVERRRNGVVGKLLRREGQFLVELDDPRLPPLLVLAAPPPEGALGRAVLARFVDAPDRNRLPRLRVESILGASDSPRALVTAVFVSEGLDLDFPPALRDEAGLFVDERAQRRGDLRDLCTVTIDGADARDFDDALSIVPASGGRMRLFVHIADVAAHVPPGSPLDREARHRGCSVYPPGGVVPMLPPWLSSDRCSLLEGEERLCLSCEMVLDREGQIVRQRLQETRICSDHRLTYEDVERHLEGTRFPDGPLAELLDGLAEITTRRKQLRRKRGGLELFLPNAVAEVDEEGALLDLRPSRDFRSYGMVEECMLAANETVAELMKREGLPSLYRLHDAPPPESILGLETLLATYGLSTRRLPLDRKENWPRLLEALKDHPAEEALLPQLIRAQARACYAAAPSGHFGLALPTYLHFTSPIRRYPDLWAHQRLKAWLAHLPVPPSSDADADLALHCSLRERRAERIEGRILQRLAARLLAPRTGESFTGIVADVRPEGLSVQIDSPYVRGFVSLSALDDDFYVFHEDDRSLRGRRGQRSYRLGDRLRLVLEDADPVLGRVDFRPERHLARGPR